MSERPSRANGGPAGTALFVTGTDTGVGKTVATAAIACALAARGQRVAVLKPAQTGVARDEPGDAEFVLAAAGSGQAPADAYVYRYRAPAAPLVAARAEGGAVEPARIVAACARLRARYDVVLVESAGGLLVPLADGWNMADLARALAQPVLVVARPGLGTLNHTLLTVEALRARGLEPLGVVLCGWREPADLASRTNPALLCQLGRLPVLGVLPWDLELSVERLALGRLREWAPRSLAPPLGGDFDVDAFLARCDQDAAVETPE